jgi:hypothetical protein
MKDTAVPPTRFTERKVRQRQSPKSQLVPKTLSMAQIKIEEVVEHLSYEMKRALEEAVLATVEDAEFNREALFRNFVRAVGHKCSPGRKCRTNMSRNEESTSVSLGGRCG